MSSPKDVKNYFSFGKRLDIEADGEDDLEPSSTVKITSCESLVWF